MQKLKSIAILSLLIFTLAPSLAFCTGPEQSQVVEVLEGTTQFTIQGESFRVETPQKLRLIFDGVSAERVWGRIVLEEADNRSPIKLQWLRAPSVEHDLHNGLILGTQSTFDSEKITGHNEK